MHRSVVIRNRDAHRYEAICDVCGILATSPTKKGEMEQKAARHEGRPIPMIVRRATHKAIDNNPRTKKDWMIYIQNHNLKALGQGISRTVYALDDKRVIKIENDGRLKQCNNEVTFWNSSSEKMRQFLAPILDHGKDWIIMARATMTLGKFGGREDVVTTTLRSATRCNDLHPDNIGFFSDGSFKVIDYGL